MEPTSSVSFSAKFMVSVALALFVLLGGVFLYFYMSTKDTYSPEVMVNPTPLPSFPTSEESEEAGELIPEAATVPGSDIPESNPFVATENPFEDAYKNPFE